MQLNDYETEQFVVKWMKEVANNVINPTCKHKWDDGWVCSKCGVRKADWVENNIKTTTRMESL